MNSSNIQQISPEHPQTNVPMATLAIMLSTAVVIMDINIAGIALPAMQGSFKALPWQQQAGLQGGSDGKGSMSEPSLGLHFAR